MPDVEYIHGPLHVQTKGLRQRVGCEIRADVSAGDLVGECRAFLETISDYVLRTGRRLRAEETTEYGYWLAKFVAIDETTLGVWERRADGEDYQPGITLTVSYWRDQHRLCAEAGSDFAPPRPDELAAISAGVFEGDPVDAVRYLPDNRMSGWCFFTDRYGGDIASLTYEHLYHVTYRRPDLAPYVALQPGFCFDLNAPRRIWHDERAARAPR